MGDFEELVRAAEAARADTWDFTWLDGRAVEERPSWRYFDRVVERVRDVASLLEIDSGTGSMIGSLPRLPSLAVATDGFAPSVAVAAPKLQRRGVHLIVTSQRTARLPFASGSFELVISRHPIDPWWHETAHVLQPGGTYLAQHVGPESLRSLSEFLMGPLPKGDRRTPERERHAAEAAGLRLERLETERPRTAFFDIGAVVYFLRLVPWIVPGFTVARYRERLLALHEVIERYGAFETTASRMLIEARKPEG